MPHWLDAINALAAQATPAVLVTVASVTGSGPREAGAKMLVTQHAQFDTIGGGHMEMRACEVAREMLASSIQRRIERFALGPSLGQCCGGVVHLVFENIDADAYRCYERLGGRWRERQDSWRLLPLDEPLPPALIDHDGQCVFGSMRPFFMQIDCAQSCHLTTDANGKRWLVDPCVAYRAHLALFGAGHVGTAIVRALADLPCYITWVDERDDMFPPVLPANVRIEATDIPEAVVDDAPAGSSYLVLTHSHALDQRLAEAILRRSDAGWFGLIGSKTKRMQFEHRLRERGIPAERLAHMVCPIGMSGISGKTPAVIAASVAAQLLQVWEAEEESRKHTTAPTLHTV